MTPQEAIKNLKKLKSFHNGSYGTAIDLAIKTLGTQSCDCVRRKDVIILIDEATELHPYKVIGDSETYSNYNQGWTDACDWLYANIESDNLSSVTPKENDKLKYLKGRPCEVCEFHSDNGCSKWKCVFEEGTK